MAKPTFFSSQQKDQNNKTTVIGRAIQGTPGTLMLYIGAGALGAILTKANAEASNDGMESEPSAENTLLISALFAGGVVGIARNFNTIDSGLTQGWGLLKAVGIMCTESIKSFMP